MLKETDRLPPGLLQCLIYAFSDARIDARLIMIARQRIEAVAACLGCTGGRWWGQVKWRARSSSRHASQVETV